MFLIPNVHSLCSDLRETREVNFSLHDIGIQPPPQWTLRVFMDLNTQPSPSHGETYKQCMLTGPWALWEDMTLIPQAAMSGIHRGNGACRSPYCPTACGRKTLLSQMILSQRTTVVPARSSRMKDLGSPREPSFWTHIWEHTITARVICTFYVLDFINTHFFLFSLTHC